MAAFHLKLLLLFTVVLVSVGGRKLQQRSRRGLIELAGEVRCSTGKSPLIFLPYGCYCGPGGQGKPVDDVDWCCVRHDCCYGKAESEDCLPKITPYNWICEDHHPQCEKMASGCEQELCKCDREAAECLANATANHQYRLDHRFQLHCGENPEPCD